ncbi:cobyric acid synthase [Halostagnicola kamekurae]|nr:cobyric acid synthase [Halostagnicola kamekurae]
MTRTILVAGTASHVGKSTVAAGLCRYLANRGVSVAPFKGQNMSNNARVVVRPTAVEEPPVTERGSDETATHADQWGEIGVSQYVQAKAAGIAPTTDMNPVLLKPRGDGESQLVVHGSARTHLAAGEYYEDYWGLAREAARKSYRGLAADHDVIVAEGAGSIAEINLHDRDLANVETAHFTDATIVLLVDIERGGAFASLYGTLELLPDDIRERVAGAIITKFRGDRSLLEPGIESIERRTGVPILGVIPYDDPGLPEEDSVSLPGPETRKTIGVDDGTQRDRYLKIAVPRLPRISNATDLEALAAHPDVAVEYVPLEGGAIDSDESDAIVLPGTKNTVDDLLAIEASGLGAEIADFDGPIVGICGGYQMLGERITNASVEGTGDRDVVEGIGLLPIETAFDGEKVVEQTTVEIDGSESTLLAEATGTASGYEIHVGKTTALERVGRPLGEASAARGKVLGTYLHGLFENDAVRHAFVDYLRARADDSILQTDGDAAERSGSADGARASDPDKTHAAKSPYDRAAALVADHVDLSELGVEFD